MTDQEFLALSTHHPDCLLEVSASGEVEVQPPRYSNTGSRSLRIGARLMCWTESTPEGAKGEAFDASTGFKLPNGARRSPDASWVSKLRIEALPSSAQETFFTLCPDFVIELRSTNDRLSNLRRKMEEYIDNGAQLGWLIDPQEKSVTIYRPGRDPEVLWNPFQVAGEGPVTGFLLPLQGIIG
jgi:Uma2 family endonuclease